MGAPAAQGRRVIKFIPRAKNAIKSGETSLETDLRLWAHGWLLEAPRAEAVADHAFVSANRDFDL